MWEVWEDDDNEIATYRNVASSSGAGVNVKQEIKVKHEFKQEKGMRTSGGTPAKREERTGRIHASEGTPAKREIKEEQTGGICSSGENPAKRLSKRECFFKTFDDELPFLDHNVARVRFDELTLPQQRVAAGSWVEVCQDEADRQKWTLNCRACACTVATWFDIKIHYENRRCRPNLLQHAQTTKHRHNVLIALSLDVDGIGRPIADSICPTVDEFKSTWHAFTDGKLTGESLDARSRSLVDCLDKAVRELTKDALVSAATIALMRDERRQRLLLRFSCCSSDLVTNTGVVGVASHFGTGHIAISTATTNLIHRICNGDQAMTTAVLNKVELLCVDAASDEVLSGERMRGRSGEPVDVPTVTPNLKMIFRDGAHAARRFLSRLWKADDTINAVIDKVLRNKHSIIMRIHNSLVFTGWFEEEVRRDGGTVKNLRAAKHRFESYAVPLNRTVTHLPAVIRTAERIARERHGQVEGHDSVAFLQWVSPRSVMLLAMLADAAAEVLTFTRQCDQEDVDSAELPAHLSGLLTRIEFLFCQGACVKVEACFAAKLCKRIQTTRIMYYVDGVPRTLAEPSIDDLQHGIGVLTRWARMVSDTAAAEFPDFTVPAAFHIFSLAEKATPGVRGRENAVAVKRLAQVFEVCPIQFEQDLVRWRPIAEQFHKNTRCGNKEAWARALRPLLQRARRGEGGNPREWRNPGQAGNQEAREMQLH